MASAESGTHTDFDDYRYALRIAVVVRWFLLAAWFSVNNYRATYDSELITTDALAAAVAALNAYLHWNIWRRRPVSARLALSMSLVDLAMITAGIAITSRFENSFYILYYPALIGLAVIFPSRAVAFAVVTGVAVTYIAISLGLEPGVDFDIVEERMLFTRVVIMYAVVAAGNLITRVERERRREAVEAEREQFRANLELQARAQEAELQASETRYRVSREIHDGIAQSMYILHLNLETCAELAGKQAEGALKERLDALVPLAKQTLLETRHYIHDLKPMLVGDGNVATMAANQVREFEAVAGIPVRLSTSGEVVDLPVASATGLYRILQEALANTLKHARASAVDVSLEFEPGGVRILVRDDGVGYEPSGDQRGQGVANMRSRAAELGGTFEITSAPGEGTRIAVSLPVRGSADGVGEGADS